MIKFVSVSEAAEMANVTVKTIYYHLNKSYKLPRIYSKGVTYVSVDALKQLYPASKSGSKQHISNVRYISRDTLEKLKAEVSVLEKELIKRGELV